MAKAAEEEDSPELKAFYAAVGHRVRTLRERASMTQKDLFARSTIRQPYIFEIEKYGVNLSLKSLFKLAEAFDVAPRDLLPGALTAEDYETKYRELREKVLELCSALHPISKHSADLARLLDTGGKHLDIGGDGSSKSV
jgi:transcriptional regulator with XRE-family HTH domain